jgi:F-type H+-transporting ATPase subunit b
MVDTLQAKAAEAAGHSGGFVEALMLPNPGIMIWVWVVFIALLVLLHKFAWKPILASVNDRETTLKESISKAEEAAARTTALEAEHQRMLAEARAEAAKILAESREFAAKFKANSEADARATAEGIVAQAKVELDAIQAQARIELRKEAATLSVAIAERILREEISASKAAGFNDKMISETLKN